MIPGVLASGAVVSAAGPIGHSSLSVGSDGTPASSSMLIPAAGSVAPAANSLCLLQVCYTTSGGTFADAPTSVTGLGVTWTALDVNAGKSQPGAFRNVSYYVAQGAFSAGAVTVTWPYIPDDLTWMLFEETGVTVGGGGVTCVKQANRVNTWTNGTSLQGWMQDLQAADNAIVSFHTAGANGQTLDVAAGETGWTRVGFIAGAAGAIISAGAIARNDGGDLSPKMSWGSSASPTFFSIELEKAGNSEQYPLAWARTLASSGFTGSTASYVTGATSVTDIATTDTSPVISSATAGFDSSWVGASVVQSGNTNIPSGSTVISVNANGREATISNNATGTAAAVTVTVTGRKTTFTNGRAYFMAIQAVRNGDTQASRTPSSVALTTGGAWTLVGTINASSGNFTLHVYKFVCASTVSDTVTATFGVNQTQGICSDIVEVTGYGAGLTTANVVSSSPVGNVTTVPLTMGAYGAAKNGVIVFSARSSSGSTKSVPGAGLVIVDDLNLSSSRILVSAFARSNIAVPDITVGSAVVAALAVEIVGA